MCMAEIEGWAGEGRVLLETDELIFRGAKRLAVRLESILDARADDGWLVVAHAEGEARFDLGAAAEKWAYAITHPRTRADKMGVKAGSRVLVLGLSDDATFLAELRERTDTVDTDGDEDAYDVAFLHVEEAADLAELAPLVERIRPAGGIWVIRPKGRPDLAHEVVVAAAKAAGLIDNKSARFSDTLTGLRFVIPKANRTRF